jgi:type III restriction enzyme
VSTSFDQHPHVMANESYRISPTSCRPRSRRTPASRFGKLAERHLFANLPVVVDGQEQPIGKAAAAAIHASLIAQNMLDERGFIREAFNPRRLDFRLELPPGQEELAAQVVDLLSSYQLERHIARDPRTPRPTTSRRRVALSPEFAALWERIRPKTTYRVEFTPMPWSIMPCWRSKRMERIQPPQIDIQTAGLRITHSGVGATLTHAAKERASGYDTRPVPDLLAYLQNETELTRSTLVRILKESGRLGEFFNDPQRFMDTVARSLKYELHRMLVDGIKYERIGDGQFYAQELFEKEELQGYLTKNMLQADKSVYEHIVYDSDVEAQFAQAFEHSADVKCYAKLPAWFKIETPLGTYNPDWAVLVERDDEQKLYLVVESKGSILTGDLRATEQAKIDCGKAHFEALGSEVRFQKAHNIGTLHDVVG